MNTTSGTGLDPVEIPEWWTTLGSAASVDLFSTLLKVTPRESLKNWLKQPNKSFGCTPAELIESGHTRPIHEMIENLSDPENR